MTSPTRWVFLCYCAEDQTLHVQDIETEDLLSHFFEAHQFIDEAIAGGGAVLVHCAGLYVNKRVYH
jgi:protein-tyrosine phosphatase